MKIKHYKELHIYLSTDKESGTITRTIKGQDGTIIFQQTYYAFPYCSKKKDSIELMTSPMCPIDYIEAALQGMQVTILEEQEKKQYPSPVDTLLGISENINKIRDNISNRTETRKYRWNFHFPNIFCFFRKLFNSKR